MSVERNFCSKLRILSLSHWNHTYIVLQIKKNPLYVFLLCVKCKIVFNLIYDSLNLFLIKTNIGFGLYDAISLGEKNGKWGKGTKGI